MEHWAEFYEACKASGIICCCVMLHRDGTLEIRSGLSRQAEINFIKFAYDHMKENNPTMEAPGDLSSN